MNFIPGDKAANVNAPGNNERNKWRCADVGAHIGNHFVEPEICCQK